MGIDGLRPDGGVKKPKTKKTGITRPRPDGGVIMTNEKNGYYQTPT